MPIRITIISEPNWTVVKVDGRLEGDDVEELIRTLTQQAGPLTLDLVDLQSMDRGATAVLRKLIDEGVALCGVSPYVELLLKSKTSR